MHMRVHNEAAAHANMRAYIAFIIPARDHTGALSEAALHNIHLCRAYAYLEMCTLSNVHVCARACVYTRLRRRTDVRIRAAADIA